MMSKSNWKRRVIGVWEVKKGYKGTRVDRKQGRKIGEERGRKSEGTESKDEKLKALREKILLKR